MKTTFANLNEVETNSLIASIKAGEYNAFLGAGVSLDATNGAGVPFPSGEALRARLCEVAGLTTRSTMQRAASALTVAQIEIELTTRFLGAVPGPSLAPFPRFLWKRIYTLNIDEGLEAAYRLPGNLQRPVPYHFQDTFDEPRSLDTVPIMHLHGRVAAPSRGYVFDRAAYAKLMSENNAWMTVLAEVMPVEPFIVMGTSLDEIDLAFYLAKRSSDTQREDRGPSFLVEPYPDAQTTKECERHGMHLYVGTAVQFFAELEALIPERPGAYDLVAESTRDLFPKWASNSLVLSFASDFERVPATPPVQGSGIQFAYGHPPNWNDLARNWDVGRKLSSRIRPILEAYLGKKIAERALVVLDDSGTGKTTVLRRVAYDLSTAGVTVLCANALSRLEPTTTAEALDLIDKPTVIIVDNLADQAASLKSVIEASDKPDFYVLGADRSYRKRHIVRSLGDAAYQIVAGLTVDTAEATQLVTSYVQRGIAGAAGATKNPAAFASQLVDEPIAVASCLILNNMQPLDRIISSTYKAAQQNERIRYLCAALAQYCFSGGARYEIVSAVSDRSFWREQFDTSHPLPLDFFDSRKDFVVPLNATLAIRTLETAPKADILTAFEQLSRGLAPRVNRNAIKRRMPEARLAGRLFDYEDVVRKFLLDDAGSFYANAQKDWRWNSRYWEQIALYLLARYRVEKDPLLLQQAVQHARHAVGVETHPMPLTTLGKVLLAQIAQPGMSNAGIYSEAHKVLVDAIRIETARSRISVHAYVTMFRGVLAYVGTGGYPTAVERLEIENLIKAVSKYFPRDTELKEVSEQVAKLL